MSETIDTIITHAHLFTMAGQGVGYVPDGAVAVQGDRITAVGPTSDLTARFQPTEIIDASGCAVLPGLIDAHMHTPYAVVRVCILPMPSYGGLPKMCATGCS